MREVLTLFLLAGILASCSPGRTKLTSEHNQSNVINMSKKEIVGTFLGAVAKQDTATMREIANADYIIAQPGKKSIAARTGCPCFVALI